MWLQRSGVFAVVLSAAGFSMKDRPRCPNQSSTTYTCKPGTRNFHLMDDAAFLEACTPICDGVPTQLPPSRSYLDYSGGEDAFEGGCGTRGLYEMETLSTEKEVWRAFVQEDVPCAFYERYNERKFNKSGDITGYLIRLNATSWKRCASYCTALLGCGGFQHREKTADCRLSTLHNFSAPVNSFTAETSLGWSVGVKRTACPPLNLTTMSAVRMDLSSRDNSLGTVAKLKCPGPIPDIELTCEANKDANRVEWKPHDDCKKPETYHSSLHPRKAGRSSVAGAEYEDLGVMVPLSCVNACIRKIDCWGVNLLGTGEAGQYHCVSVSRYIDRVMEGAPEGDYYGELKFGKINTRGVAKLTELTPEETSDLFLCSQKVQRMLERKYRTTSTTLNVLDGELAGQSVYHVHVHLLPRHEGDFKNNDDIYVTLSSHDKGPQDPKTFRSHDVMAQEAGEFRQLLKGMGL